MNAFDQLIGTGNTEVIKLAVAGMKAQYDDANGYEGRTLQGKAPFEVAKKGKKKGLLTIALVASVDSNAYSELNKFFDIIIPFQKKSTKYSIQNAKKLIKEESKRLAEIIDLSEKII